MNLDQRNDDQPIHSGELPVVAGPSENPNVVSRDEEFEESSFSKWILPVSLFLVTIFTTLWAGAYQVYNGPIHGPVNFLLEHPETLWRGIPFAATLLIILVTHEVDIAQFAKREIVFRDGKVKKDERLSNRQRAREVLKTMPELED